jgi:integrase
MTRGQAAALMAAADGDPHRNAAGTAAVVAVLLYTGIRVGELLAADVADLGYDRGHRTLTVTRKGGKRAILALPAPPPARAGR